MSTAVHGTACRTCRRRGRKCDRRLPSCKACEQRRVRCEGYITRWLGVAARGRLAGQSVPVTVKTRDVIATPGECKASGSSGVPDDDDDDDDDEIRDLLDYFTREQTTIFYLGADPQLNPYVRFVLPLVPYVSPVRYSIASSAAYHLAARKDDRHLGRRGLALRIKATEALRHRLKQHGLATTFGSLMATLMMAQLDICLDDPGEFEIHLKAAQDIVDLRGSDEPQDLFVKQRLLWLDVMGSTTSRRTPALSRTSPMAVISRLQPADDEWSWRSDCFPCPIELFRIIVGGTLLYKAHQDQEKEQRSVTTQALKLVNDAESWIASLDEIANQPRAHLELAYGHAVVLYLCAVFQLENRSRPDLRSIAHDIVQHAKAMPPATAWSYSMSWPLYQAGLYLDHTSLQERVWLTTHFKATLSENGCCQVNRALETLQMVWRDERRTFVWNSIEAGSQKSHLLLV